ncbi:calcium-binding protein [Sphingomonas sp. YL-JM2C]
MANFIFEEGSQIDASGFTGSDTLYFKTAAPSDVSVVYTAAAGLSTAKITLTVGTQSLDFAASALSDGTITFIAADGNLLIGQDDATDPDTLAINSSADSAAYGFAGNDTITATGTGDHLVYGGAGNDSITATGSGNDNIYGDAGNDVLDGSGSAGNLNIFGGDGADTITGGTGNDHLYGQSAAGGSDGADIINGGAGSDYIQGNAGADTLNGGTGSDRIYGGADNDIIHGDAGDDTINGNKGDDTIFGDGGDDRLRGGAGNDNISGGDGNDVILGDLGDDTINGGTGADLLTGGDGDDVFVFAAGDAAKVTLGSGSSAQTYYDTITDFTVDSDLLKIENFDGGDVNVIHQGAGVTLSTFAAAQTYAQGLLSAGGGAADSSIVAVQVGTDTYLFYDSDGEYATTDTINSYIHLTGVTAADVTADSFVTAAV